VTEDADSRRVPRAEGRGEVREKGSRFLGVAVRAASPSAAEEILENLRRRYHDATHVAFAWRIGAGSGLALRASDAGEPAGTAGRPIAAAIEAAGLTDTLVAVVRYFGGTKLGTGGLARAYRLAAVRALAAAGAETVFERVHVAVRCPYEKSGLVRRLLDPPEVRLVSERFTPEPALDLEVRRSRLAELRTALDEARLEYSVE
jgi:uncharacterized YigZ family protein